MAGWKRRDLLKAGVGLPFIGWNPAQAQTATRNLSVAERKPAAIVEAGTSLLLAPRRALVIGNSSYGFAPLKNPSNDAKAMAEELKRIGFQVISGIDLPRDEMLNAIRSYGELVAKERPVGVFYYAGHGVQLAWRNYLVPVDASIDTLEDIAKKCVDVNAVIEGIAKASNPMNVVILDACRNNPFGDAVKLEQKGLSQLDAPPGTLLAYATAPGNSASDGAGANGLYTENLLREIQVPETKIEDVFKRVRLAVRRRSAGLQIPWESTSLEDDFWFIPPPDLRKAALDEAGRQKHRDEVARAYKEDLERRRRQAESDRAFEEELAFWNRASMSSEAAQIEQYLKQYPSGRFAEIAQAQLDAILARDGEKKIQIPSQAQNPYTQGSAIADTRYKKGDRYTYNQLDIYSKAVTLTYTQTVTNVSDREVVFNDGEIVTDLLGNPLRKRDGRIYSPNQRYPSELQVGKRWSTRFKTDNPSVGGTSSSLDVAIVAKEKVTVPAGTFDCYRIEVRGYTTNRMGLLAHNGKMWVCPERVRVPVVVEELTMSGWGKPARSERYELVSFQQA